MHRLGTFGFRIMTFYVWYQFYINFFFKLQKYKAQSLSRNLFVYIYIYIYTYILHFRMPYIKTFILNTKKPFLASYNDHKSIPNL